MPSVPSLPPTIFKMAHHLLPLLVPLLVLNTSVNTTFSSISEVTPAIILPTKRDKGIKTFRDNEELETGKPISSILLEAIEKLRIAVVILSKKYASLSWCLEELAKIFECMDAGRMRVLPIFYHVNPSDVRHLKRTFAEEFAKHVLPIFHNVHDQRFKEKKLQRWSAALRRVAVLSGHHVKDE